MDSEIFSLYYIGRCKSAWNAEPMAYAMNEHLEWKVLLLESAMKKWFGFEVDPAGAVTLYGVLGVKREATADEIKSAYRRMAMQWHPDRCKEAGAQETFLRIQEAYDILSGSKRGKYDAGLALEQTIKRSEVKQEDKFGYRSPLRNGMVAVEGYWTKPKSNSSMFNGKFVVENILAWTDLVDGVGRTLISSWQYGNKQPTLVWA